MHIITIAALQLVLFYSVSDCLLSKQGKKNMSAIIIMEINDKKVKKILEDALIRYNKNMEKNPYYYRLKKVHSARKRYSPSATIYDIDYSIEETECERKTVKTANVDKKCTPKSGGNKLHCNYTFHYQNKFLIFEQYDVPCSPNVTRNG